MTPMFPPGSTASYLCLGPGFSSAANTPFRKHKTWMHEGGTATPFIVHWPEGIQERGELRTTPGHVIDFAPTVLDIIGAKVPTSWKGDAIPSMPGRSLLASVKQDTTIERDLLWWMHDGHRAVRVDKWKLVADEGQPWELYNLDTDRAESNDLSKARPEKARELERAWERQLNAMIETVSKSD